MPKCSFCDREAEWKTDTTAGLQYFCKKHKNKSSIDPVFMVRVSERADKIKESKEDEVDDVVNMLAAGRISKERAKKELKGLF